MKRSCVLFICLWTFLTLFKFTDSCSFRPSTGFKLYENTPVGEKFDYGLVNTYPDDLITLDATLATYFKIDADFKLELIKEVTRDNTEISGVITCLTHGDISYDEETLDATFYVLRYNNVSPVVCEDQTFEWEENLSELYDTTLDKTIIATDDDIPEEIPINDAEFSFEIISQEPDDYMAFRNPNDPQIYAKKPMDYEDVKQVFMEIRVTTTGIEEGGGTYVDETTANITINVIDLDDNKPQLQNCTTLVDNGDCVPPLYVGFAKPGSAKGETVDVSPTILLTDLDGLATTTTYSLLQAEGLMPTTKFTIDPITAVISLNEALDASERGDKYSLVVVANQDDNYFLSANVEITISVEDTSPPIIAPSSTSGSISDADAAGPVIDSSGFPITITSTDADEDSAEFSYIVSPSEFQVANGVLYYFPDLIRKTVKAVTTVEITCININADISSANRESLATRITVDSTPGSLASIHEGSTDNTTLYIVAGVLSAVILLLIFLLIYLVCKDKNNHKVDSISEDKIELDRKSSSSYSNHSYKSDDQKSNHSVISQAVSDKFSELSEKRANRDDNSNHYSVTISDAEQGETSEYVDPIEPEIDRKSLYSSTISLKMEEDQPTKQEEDEISHHEESHDFSNETASSYEEPAVAESDVNSYEYVRDPPVIPIPPPPTTMFNEQPSALIEGEATNFEGAILTYSLACQRNLSEHLRYLKQKDGSSTELVSLKRFGIDKKDTFAVVKSFQTSQMFDHQVASIEKLDELMFKIGTSQNGNIIQYYGQHKEEDFIRHAIEFVPNGCLNDFFQKDQRSGNSRMRMNIIAGITKGLSFIHSNNIVHGKLSSYCVWIDENLQAKLHGYEDNLGLKLEQDDHKRRWQAPEVLDGEICTKASDIWSLGVVIWEIITGGEIPYDGMDVADIRPYLDEGKRLTFPETCSNEMRWIVEQGCLSNQISGRLDAKIFQSKIEEKLLEDPELLIGANLEPKVNFSENHRVRFEDLDDITEF